MISVRIFGKLATISNGIWTSRDKHLKKLLTDFISFANVTAVSPNYDLNIATASIKQFGGKIVKVKQSKEILGEPGAIY